jgi:hypothetical protein
VTRFISNNLGCGGTNRRTAASFVTDLAVRVGAKVDTLRGILDPLYVRQNASVWNSMPDHVVEAAEHLERLTPVLKAARDGLSTLVATYQGDTDVVGPLLAAQVVCNGLHDDVKQFRASWPAASDQSEDKG